MRVLFVCQHGAAKSVIAAQYLRRLATVEGQSVEVGSAGVEPDPEIPPHVLAGLAADGAELVAEPPRAASEDIIAAADIVVSFGCDLTSSANAQSGTRFIRWDDVPAVSDGYAPARDAIAGRVRVLLDQITAGNGQHAET